MSVNIKYGLGVFGLKRKEESVKSISKRQKKIEVGEDNEVTHDDTEDIEWLIDAHWSDDPFKNHLAKKFLNQNPETNETKIHLKEETPSQNLEKRPLENEQTREQSPVIDTFVDTFDSLKTEIHVEEETRNLDLKKNENSLVMLLKEKVGNKVEALKMEMIKLAQEKDRLSKINFESKQVDQKSEEEKMKNMIKSLGNDKKELEITNSEMEYKLLDLEKRQDLSDKREEDLEEQLNQIKDKNRNLVSKMSLFKAELETKETELKQEFEKRRIANDDAQEELLINNSILECKLLELEKKQDLSYKREEDLESSIKEALNKDIQNQKTIAKMTEQVESLTKLSERLRAEKDALEEQLKLDQEDLEISIKEALNKDLLKEKTIIDLTDQVETIKKESEKSKNEKDVLEEQFNQIHDENRILLSKLGIFKADLEEKDKELKDEVNKQKTAHDESIQTIKKLTEQVESFTKLSEKSRAEKDVLKEQLNQIQALNRDLVSKINISKVDLEAKDTELKQEVDKLRIANDEALEAKKESQFTLFKMRAKEKEMLEKNIVMKQRLQELETITKERENDRNGSSNSMDILQTNLINEKEETKQRGIKIETLDMEIRKLKEEMRTLEEENMDLKSELMDRKEDEDKKIKELGKENEELKTKNQRVILDCELLDHKVMMKDNEEEVIKKKEKKKDKRTFERQIDKIKAKMKIEFQSAKRNYKERIKSKESVLAEKEEKIKELNIQLILKDSELQKMKKHVKKPAEDVMDIVNDAEDEIKVMEDKNEKKETRDPRVERRAERRKKHLQKPPYTPTPPPPPSFPRYQQQQQQRQYDPFSYNSFIYQTQSQQSRHFTSSPSPGVFRQQHDSYGNYYKNYPPVKNYRNNGYYTDNRY